MATNGNIFKRSFNSLWQNPIIVKELRSRMRRRRSYSILTVFLTFSAAVVSLVYFGIASSNEFYPDPDVRRTLGQAIFLTVVLLQLGAVNFVTPAFTAGSIVDFFANTNGQRQAHSGSICLLPGQTKFLFKSIIGKTCHKRAHHKMVCLVLTEPLVAH